MIITIKEVPAIQEVTIVMTKEEASILMEITHHVGGAPNGPRGAIDRLRNSLDEACISRFCTINSPDVSGSVTIDKPSLL